MYWTLQKICIPSLKVITGESNIDKSLTLEQKNAIATFARKHNEIRGKRGVGGWVIKAPFSTREIIYFFMRILSHRSLFYFIRFSDV